MNGKAVKVRIPDDVRVQCSCCDLLSHGMHVRWADYWLVLGPYKKPRCAVHARAYPHAEGGEK